MRDCILFILEIAFTETAQQTVITNDVSHVKLLLSLVQNGYLNSILLQINKPHLLKFLHLTQGELM